jgi:hypothetical protein
VTGLAGCRRQRSPAYVPKLNPMEYIWGYWKRHELPNFCPRDFAQLSISAPRPAAHAPAPPTGAILLAAGKSVTMICRGSIDVEHS